MKSYNTSPNSFIKMSNLMPPNSTGSGRLTDFSSVFLSLVSPVFYFFFQTYLSCILLSFITRGGFLFLFYWEADTIHHCPSLPTWPLSYNNTSMEPCQSLGGYICERIIKRNEQNLIIRLYSTVYCFCLHNMVYLLAYHGTTVSVGYRYRGIQSVLLSYSTYYLITNVGRYYLVSGKVLQNFCIDLAMSLNHGKNQISSTDINMNFCE